MSRAEVEAAPSVDDIVQHVDEEQESHQDAVGAEQVLALDVGAYLVLPVGHLAAWARSAGVYAVCGGAGRLCGGGGVGGTVDAEHAPAPTAQAHGERPAPGPRLQRRLGIGLDQLAAAQPGVVLHLARAAARRPQSWLIRAFGDSSNGMSGATRSPARHADRAQIGQAGRPASRGAVL